MYYTVNLTKDKSTINPYISGTLLEKIKFHTNAGEKIILYLNKRGEYSSLICKDCQNLYKCPRCDSSLSIHNNSNELLCHFCSYRKDVPHSCEICKSVNLMKVGVGTQQIEKVIKDMFPKKNIFRFDFDSVKNATEKENALSALHQADIIIGTKMITTGYDFTNIGLIVIILAEQELMIPSYDAEEKVFINSRQLIGRARQEEVDVVLQTFIPDNPFIKTLSEKNYKDFFIETLEERKIFSLPPFSEIAILEFRDMSKEKGRDFMTRLFHKLKTLDTKGEFEIIASGNIRKKYNQYFHQIHIKGKDIRKLLASIKEEIQRNGHLSVHFE